MMRRYGWALWIVVLLGLTGMSSTLPVHAQQIWRTAEISQDQFGWFPDLAVDQAGTVHVIWGSGAIDPNVPDPAAPEASLDLLRYRAWQNGGWTTMNDVVFTCTGGYTVRNSLTVNIDGQLQALVRTCFDQSTLNVAASDAWSALNWTAPRRLGTSYYNALAADSQGRLHALYNEMVFGEPEQAALASEIFYRRSDDGGQTWSVRMNLANLIGGDERMQIKVDAQDRVHVVWDHGSDWYLGLDNPGKGIYRRSDTAGETWLPQVSLGLGDDPVVQTTLGLTLEGNPLVVYRSALRDEIFYQYSPDGGNNWTAAEPIPGIRARDPIERGLDSYTLTTDSANRLHLIAVGFPEGSNAMIPMLLHLVWDGQRWSEPLIVAQGPNYPMWPRAVIAQGNQLHVTWFTYTEVSDWGERRVWHGWTQLDSPTVAASAPRPIPVIVPTPTPEILPELPIARIGGTLDSPPFGEAFGSVSNGFRDLPPPTASSGQYDLLVVGLALAAVLGLLGAVTAFTLWLRSQ